MFSFCYHLILLQLPKKESKMLFTKYLKDAEPEFKCDAMNGCKNPITAVDGKAIAGTDVHIIKHLPCFINMKQSLFQQHF